MTDSIKPMPARPSKTQPERPAAFRRPSPKPKELFLFFGKGDYVIAATANEASCLWMDHFDDLCYAREFDQVPSDEVVEIYIDSDDTACALWVMTQEELAAHRAIDVPDAWSAKELIERFGPGYLASTTED